MKITKEQRDQLTYRIVDQGIEYAFVNYSHWQEIEDEVFHEQREAFLEAYNKFNEYLQQQGLTDEG